MKALSDNSNLPSNFTALRFVCGCFGIGEKELAETLERMRQITKNPNAHFPKKLSRELLARAENRKGRWQEALSTIHREALYNRMRRENGEPLFSFTGKFSQETTFTLLTLYERLLPKLNCCGVPMAQAMWLLVENVFAPTVFIKLIEEWRLGLGTEWLGESCWYLPAKSDGGIQKPVSRVLDCWLRVAGFRTAYGVSQSLTRGKSDKSVLDEQTEKRWKTWKKSVERWRNGKSVQSVQKLHRLVETFAENVAWRRRNICYRCFGLRSASGESGAEGAEERCLADRSRSATPAAGPKTEARRSCGTAPCKLVTSARFVKWSGRRREGDGATGSPWSEANRALVTADSCC